MPDENAQPVAIITGAGRGVGAACAAELSGRGYRLVLASRNADELQRTTDDLAGESLVVTADIVDPATPRWLVESAVEGFGRLDAVVHCAGNAPMTPITETDDETLASAIDTNLTSLVRLAREAWGELGRRGGAIVAISSQAARDPLTPFAAYAASKAGVNALVLALAREGREAGVGGVRAYAVAPGAVETAMLRAILDESAVPRSATLDPSAVAEVVGECVAGSLRHSSGETIYLQR